MRSTRLRWVIGVAAIAAAGMVNQAACISFAGNQTLRAVDFCFLFDCQNGAIGGLFDPCPDQVESNGEIQNTFVDCPVTETQ